MNEKYLELKDSLQLVDEIQRTPMNFQILEDQRKEIQELISAREKRINISGNEILIINDNPEIDFEKYIAKIEQTLNKISALLQIDCKLK